MKFSAAKISIPILILTVGGVVVFFLTRDKATPSDPEKPPVVSVPKNERPSNSQTPKDEDPRLARNFAFSKRIENLSADKLLLLWESTQNDGLEENERRSRECQIIEKLTLLGNWDKAKDLALSKGPGLNRDALLFSLFTKSPDSLDVLIGRAKEFPADQKDTVWSGVMRNVSNPDGLKKLSDLVASGYKLNSDEAGYIAAGVAGGLDQGRLSANYYTDPALNQNQTPEELNAKFLKAEKGLDEIAKNSPEIKGELFKVFIENAGGAAPELCWTSFVSNFDSFDEKTRKNIASELADTMFSKAPEQGLDALSMLRSQGKDVSAALSAGVKQWAKIDAAKVGEWLSNPSNGLSAAERDSSTGILAKRLMDSNDIAGAKNWIEKIADSSIRAQAESDLWQEEKKEAVNTAKADPEGALKSLLKTESSYSDRGLEDVYGIWLQKDFDGAVSWYQANWNNLSPSKAQFVAAALARQSIATKDLSAARQWVDWIQDAPTKSRVLKEIEKADKK